MSQQAKPGLLIVSTTFPRWKDDPGPAPFVFLHARAMTEYFDVTVLTPHHKGAAREEVMDGVRVRRFRYGPDALELLCDGAGIQNNMRKSLVHRAMLAPLYLSLQWAAIREVRRGGCKYVNSHWIVPSGLAATVALLGRDSRHVVTLHAADWDLLQRVPGGMRLVSWIARRAVSLVSVSARIMRGLRDPVLEHEKLFLMSMGVDRDTFRFDAEKRKAWREKIGAGDDERLILFVGKLSRKKGVDVLLSAVPRLIENGREVKVAVVGEGELRHELEALAADLGIQERVTFLGALPNRELAGLYSAADAVAVPSVMDEKGETEGMPVVILEALAANRNVVASDLCSVPEELTRSRRVIVFAAGDHDALSAALSNSFMVMPAVEDASGLVRSVEQVALFYKERLTGELE